MVFDGYKKKALKLAAFAVVLSPVTAVPQSAAETQIVPVSYFGRVTDTGAIDIIQPDGGTARYSGPVPELPVSPGDVVRFSFDAEVPVGTSGSSAVYSGQKAADGLYDISFHSPALPGNAADGEGGVNPDGFGNTDRGGAIQIGSGVTFDSNTGELTPTQEEEPLLAAAQQTEPVEQESGAQVSAAQVETPSEPTGMDDGAKQSAMSLSSEVPTEKVPAAPSSNGPTDPTPVPEPGTVLLLAAASAALLSRRRPLRRS